MQSKNLREYVYCTILYLIITSTQQQEVTTETFSICENAYCKKIYTIQNHSPISKCVY